MTITPIPIDDDDIPVTEGIYLHGILERANGFDMVNIDELPKEDGIYDCSVIIKMVKYACKLYYWTVPWINGKRQDRGYIVNVTDTEYLKDAQAKYERRAERI